ncbi:MAG: type II toxin-antitoxin system PemK/MazF family toxin [Anaerolineae bacterium]
MQRGEIWWAELPDPVASEPGYRRPLLIVQADEFTRSRIQTVIGVVMTTNLRLAAAPGNLLVTADESGLPRDSVINVSQIVTIDKTFLTDRVGKLSYQTMSLVEEGLRLALALD